MSTKLWCVDCIHTTVNASEEPCVNCFHKGKPNWESKVGAVVIIDNFKETGTQGASATQVGGSHYQLPIQPIDYIVKNNLGYREGNVIKYVSRYKTKNGKEDIKKAIHYLEMILEDYEDE